MKKFFIITSLIFMTLGFRTHNLKWNISDSDPYIFIKICSDATDNLNNDIEDAGDPLYGTNITWRSLIQSLIDDVNNFAPTYITIELWPEDESSPAAGSNWTSAKAENRTIHLCPGSPGGGATSGTAEFTSSGSTMTDCKITLKSETSVKDMMGTVAHEIGHCLGLSHPQGKVHAVMSYFSKEKFRRFQIDDLTGIAMLYPHPTKGGKEKSNLGLKCSFD